jgi:hypothetical protein
MQALEFTMTQLQTRTYTSAKSVEKSTYKKLRHMKTNKEACTNPLGCQCFQANGYALTDCNYFGEEDLV